MDATQEEMNLTIESAVEGYQSWSKETVELRYNLLEKLYDLIC